MNNKSIALSLITALLVSIFANVGFYYGLPRVQVHEENGEVTLEQVSAFAPIFRTELSGTDSHKLGYRLVMENYSICNSTEQHTNDTVRTLPIDANVSRSVSHVVLYIVFEAQTAGKKVEVWTNSSATSSIDQKIAVIAQVTTVKITGMAILPINYGEDVYWQMDESNANTKVTIHLIGYFERSIGAMR